MPRGHTNGHLGRGGALPAELFLELSTFPLSIRAQRVVRETGMKRLGDLVTADTRALLQRTNVGRTTIAELREIARISGLELGMTIPGWHEQGETITARQSRQLGNIRQRILAVDSTRGVETEVMSALRALLAPDYIERVEPWIGLDADEAPTLESVGRRLGITRERVRQCVSRARTVISGSGVTMPRLGAAISRLEAMPVCTRSTAERYLLDEGFVERRLAVRGILRAGELFGIDASVEQGSVDNLEFLGDSACFEPLALVRRTGARFVEGWGCALLEDVACAVNEACGGDLTLDLVAEVLEADPEFRWLDEESGWFLLADQMGSRNRLLNRIDKVLAVAPRIDLATLRTAVLRDPRMEGFAPPVTVLRSFCRFLDDCKVLDRRTIADTRPRVPEQVLSHMEQVIVSAFADDGPTMLFVEIRDHFRRAGLADGSCSAIVGSTPVLRRFDRGIYALVGASITNKDLDRAARRRP